MKTLREEVEGLIGEHYYCEDSWFSCPLAEGGCCNEHVDKTKCNCGRDESITAICTLIERRELEARIDELRNLTWKGEPLILTDDKVGKIIANGVIFRIDKLQQQLKDLDG